MVGGQWDAIARATKFHVVNLGSGFVDLGFQVCTGLVVAANRVG